MITTMYFFFLPDLISRFFYQTFLKRLEYSNNKDEDYSPKILNDKNHQPSSQKFRQLSSSSSWIDSMDFPNSFSPSIPIILLGLHHLI